MSADFGGPHGSTIADPPQLGRVVMNKIFAKPFRIVLMDCESRTRVFEVKTLAGLQSVVGRVDKGELFEMGKFGAITMQLWGFLAEHCGFMMATTPRTMEAGLGILGPSAALVDDMADLCGGVDAGVEMLREARRMAGVDAVVATPNPGSLAEARRHGVVEVSDEMIEKLMVPQPAEEAAAAAEIYKRVAEQSANDSENARRAVEDYASLGDIPSALRKPSGSQEAPETGLDEQGAP